MRGENLETLTCLHCGKELTEPLFRFCPHCNGNIHELRDKYSEDMKKKRLEEFTQ